MFDIGWTELLVIAVVAIIIVGPKDLPGMLRSLGRYAGKLKRTAGEFRSQFDDALRESEFDELRTSMRDMNPLDDIRNSVNEGFDPLKDTADDIRRDVESSSRRTGSGRMNTDPAPAKPASNRKAAAPADAVTRTAKKPAAAKKATASRKTAAVEKSGAGKKSPAKKRSSGSPAKAGG